jgi:hypothetical protein
MNTDPRSAHSHTTGGKTSTANGGHTHGLAAVDKALVALTAALAALTVRVAALEAPVVVPPPVDPPPVDPPPVDPPPANGVTVPGSIDNTGSSGTSAPLNAWIKAQPNGSTLIFPRGTYKLDGDAGINLSGRSGLTLIGTDCTLVNACTGASNFSSSFFLQGSTDIVIRGFTVDGGNTATGTTGAKSQVNERLNAAVIRAGCKRITFDGVKWDRTRGFGPLVSADGGSTWPEDVTIKDCIVRGGEMGIGIVAGRRVQIVGTTIIDSVYMAIDCEPDASQANGGGFVDLLIDGCRIDRYGWGQTLTSWFLAACPQDAVIGTCVMDGLIVTNNTVVQGAATADNGNADGLGGLGIRADKTNPKRNFVITGNVTADDDTRGSGRAVMNFVNVENLTVTGNRQPLPNGAVLVSDTGTTGIRNVGGNS